MEKQIKQIINAYKFKPVTKLFVGNLNPETTDDEVRQNFERFGTIKEILRKDNSDYLILDFEGAEAAVNA
jgi:RNA recognition motif-containing protein